MRLLGDFSLLQLGDITSQSFMENVALPGELLPLLYMLARHSLLLEVVETARTFLPGNFPSTHKRVDFELWDIHLPPTAQTQNTPIFQILNSNVAGTSRTVFDSVRINQNAQNRSLDPDGKISSLQQALRNLSGVPVHDLERLTMETLDLASHRLDAWITGLATRRLNNLRFREQSEGGSPPSITSARGASSRTSVRSRGPPVPSPTSATSTCSRTTAASSTRRRCGTRPRRRSCAPAGWRRRATRPATRSSCRPSGRGARAR